MSTRDTLAAIGRLAEFRTAKQRAGDRKRAQKLRGKKKGGVTKKTILKGAGIGLVGGGLLGAGAIHHRIGKEKKIALDKVQNNPEALKELKEDMNSPTTKKNLRMLTGMGGAVGAGAGALGGAAIGTGIYLVKRNKNNKKSRKRR